MPPSKIGDSLELAAKARLEADGWLVTQAHRQKFHENDLWGAFDLAGLNPQDGSLILVQTTVARGVTARKRKVERFLSAHFSEEWFHTLVEVWGWGVWRVGREHKTGWRPWVYTGGRSWRIIDLVLEPVSA